MSNQETVISLEAYATVLAGLGAGLSLPRALEHAGLLPDEWERGSEQWQAQIDESAASDLSLLVTFDATLMAAKRRFEPTVEPIESDLRAWVCFRRYFVTSVDPVAFLAKHGLSLATYARIEADWTNRTLADEALAAAVQRHTAEPLAECPVLALLPSPFVAAEVAGLPPKGSPGLVVPSPEHGPLGISSSARSLGETTFTSALSASAKSHSEKLSPPVDELPRAAPEGVDRRGDQGVMQTEPPVHGSVFLIESEHAPDETLPLNARRLTEDVWLPFRGAPGAAAPSATTALLPPPAPAHASPWHPPDMREIADVQSTLDPFSSGRHQGPALPFDPAAPSQLSAPNDASSWVPKGLRGASDLGGTAPLADPPETATLPLTSQAAASEPVPPKSTSPDWLPPGMRGFSDVGGTQIAAAAPPAGPALPFDASASPSLPLPSKAPPWTPKAMQGFTDVGGTQASPSATTKLALPFAAADPPTRVPRAKADDPPASAVPVQQRQPGHPPAPQAPGRAPLPSVPELAGPPLPLDAYACLHVELAVDPAARLNILRRFGLDEEQQRQLDAFWGARIAIDATLRKSWESFCSAHRARLLQAKRPPR